MTITMTEKHQVTIPKKIAAILRLKKGSMFDVAIKRNRIELIPLEVKEKTFTLEEYKKIDLLVFNEKGKAKKVSKALITGLKNGAL